MKDYIYEINCHDFTGFAAKSSEMGTVVLAIAKKYENELKKMNIEFDSTLGVDIIRYRIKIKPIQDNLPAEMKKELIEYFKTMSLEYQ